MDNNPRRVVFEIDQVAQRAQVNPPKKTPWAVRMAMKLPGIKTEAQAGMILIVFVIVGIAFSAYLVINGGFGRKGMDFAPTEEDILYTNK